MKLKLVQCFVLAGCLAGAGIASAQMSNQHLDFNVTNLNGMPVHGDASGSATLSYTAAVSVTTEGGRSILHRLFIDHNRHLFFGYDLEAYQVQGQQQVHLHFGPLSHLSSFPGVYLNQLTPRELPVPADETATINTPITIPLEVSDAGGKVLRDKLTFGPPN